MVASCASPARLAFMASSRIHPIARELAVLSRAGYPLIYLVTHEEARVLNLIDHAARAAKKGFLIWSSSVGFQGDHTEEMRDPVRALERLGSEEAPALVALLDLHPHLGDARVVRRLRDRLPVAASRRQSLIITAPVMVLPPELEKDAAVIDLPLPRPEELQETLKHVMATEHVQVEPVVAEKAIRSALGLSSDQAARVFRKVMVLRRGLREEDLKLVVEEKKQVLRQTEVLEFHELGDALSDVGGLGEMKRWLAARTRAFGQEARDFGLPSPKGLLLLGVQGCGKSLSAKAVAEFWKFPLLRLDVGALFSGAGGVPEAALREAIKISESLAPVVLWIDEIEKGFSQRGGDSASRVFGGFITWLAEKSAEVFVVATANDVSGLPPELLRRGRFDEIFFVDLPNQHERLEILKIHLTKRQRDPDAYPIIKELAQRAEHFSGAELEQVVVSGLYRAFSEKRELDAEDLELALKKTVPLYQTYEEQIKALRDWAKRRARPATLDSTVLDLFSA